MEKKFTIELTERDLKVLGVIVKPLMDSVYRNLKLTEGILSDTSEALLKSDFEFYSKLYCKLNFALHYNPSDKSDKNEVGE